MKAGAVLSRVAVEESEIEGPRWHGGNQWQVHLLLLRIRLLKASVTPGGGPANRHSHLRGLVGKQQGGIPRGRGRERELPRVAEVRTRPFHIGYILLLFHLM